MKKPSLFSKALPSGIAASTESPDLSVYARADTLSGYATKPELDAAITEIGVIADKITAMSAQTSPIATTSINDPALADFKKSVLDEVKKLMAGGKQVPDDCAWTPCTKVLGSGLIEARVLNGMIQLRGELVYTYTATGSFSTVQRLPDNFPKPPSEQMSVVFGYESGVTYRRVFVRFGPDGSIGIVGDGKITNTSMSGAQAYAY